MSGPNYYRWTPETEALVSREYMAGATSAQIADTLGVDRRVVTRKVILLGLSAMLTPDQRLERKRQTIIAIAARDLPARGERGQFIWTDERVRELHQRYVVNHESASAVAKAMGCEQRSVSRKASELGFSAMRPKHLRTADRLRGAATGREVMATDRASRPVVVYVPRSDDDLIAAALAAGRVTYLPPGQACGLSYWEIALKTAFPARPISTQAQRFKASRARLAGTVGVAL